MNINYFSNAEVMSQKAAKIVLEEARHKPNSLFCTATGSSPTKLYRILAEENKKHIGLFQKIRVIPLDEWIGLSTAEGSCHAYINEHVLTPLNISNERYFGFNSNAESLDKECERIQEILHDEGSIDVCILGLGTNGHLGFNEPAQVLQSHCHIAELAPKSQEHPMIIDEMIKPMKGLTLGMQDIMAAKRIILLVSGEGKEGAVTQLLSGEISNECPVTWLWKHSNVDCLILNT